MRLFSAALLLLILAAVAEPALAWFPRGTPGSSGSDPTVGLLPTSSDAYANWTKAGLNAIPFSATASGGTLTVTTSYSGALGPSQTITCSCAINGATISAFGSGTGNTGTYTISSGATVSGATAMTAAGIPNRTTIYTTLSPSGGNDTSAIQTALNNCPPGEVVLLNTGVYQINGDSLRHGAASCTLRGSGVGALLNTGINAVNADSGRTVSTACSPQTSLTINYYCPDATATQLIQIDRATNPNGPLVAMSNGRSDWNSPSASYTLASDAAQGSYSVTLSSTPSPAINVGDIVWLDENTWPPSGDPIVNYGYGAPSPFANINNLTGYGERTTDFSLTEMHQVASVSGATITFDSPVQYPFHTAYSATLSTFPTPMLMGAGIENLFLWGGMGGNGQGNIGIQRCAYCWVKNVESAWSQGGIQLTQVFRNVLRDSYNHETPDPNPGGAGYLTAMNCGTSESLFENNIMWYGNKENVVRCGGQGNVVAYNYMDDAFDATNPGQPEAGVNSAHLTTSHHTLIEGNYSQNFKGDTYWGNALFVTAMRNQFSGHRAAHAPLNAYSYTAGCTYLYGDWSGVSVVDVQAYSYAHNFVGNFLGSPTQALQTDPNHCYGPQTTFYTQVTSVAEYDACGNAATGAANCFNMWQFGQFQPTAGTAGSYSYAFSDCPGQGSQTVNENWTFDSCTLGTMTRLQNWDQYNGAKICYGYGSETTQPCSGVPSVPNSFYLSATPAFMGTQTWPWVNPTSGTLATLPAMYCFQHNQMPTCLE